MEERICQDAETAFRDALSACMESGLTVMVDGKPLTEEALSSDLLMKESSEWEGSLLRDARGQLQGISFSHMPMRNTLLQNPYTNH